MTYTSRAGSFSGAEDDLHWPDEVFMPVREILSETIDFSEIIVVLVGLSTAFLLKNHRFSMIYVSWTGKLVSNF